MQLGLKPSNRNTVRSSKNLRFINLGRPTRLDLEFCFEALKGLLCFKNVPISGPSGSVRPVLSRQFFGFCLAVPSDQSQCDYVLDLVKESGVGSARLDLTYDQDEEMVESLIQGLNSIGVKILLHLVLPLEASESFPSRVAEEEWGVFLDETYKRYGEKIEAFEIGTTINRVKWSGFDLAGFLAMWKVSHAFCRARDITMVGPNVTDFEPQYNAGVLGILAKNDLLPDIHSTNMFAERSMEPEDSDHKILGYRWRHLHGYNLQKKLFRVASIAGRSGLSRNWSTCAFWTVPRIMRRWAHAEEQIADYLVRYFVLGASQSDFERFYWGPLVSYREGLIDDGTEDRSTSDFRDVVAFYSGYPGATGSWSRRGSFIALGHLIRRISSFRYERNRYSKDGLEIHEFRNAEQVCLVGWTTNAGAALVRDCIALGDLLKMEEAYSRDGTRLVEYPDFFTQAPVYLYWNITDVPQVLQTARRLTDLVLARASSSQSYFEFRSDSWRGVVLASSKEEANVLCDALQPKSICMREERTSLRKSRNAIWTVSDPRNIDRVLVVKKPASIAWHKRILDRSKPSKALRSWNGTCELMRRDIQTPAPVAYFESKSRDEILENWFICDHVSGSRSVRCFFTRYAIGEESVEGYTFEAFSKELLVFVLRMHAVGVFFRDLAGGNILVKTSDDGSLDFSLIDTARIRCEMDGVVLRQRLADLKRLTLKLNNRQKIQFMDWYLSEIGHRFSLLQKLSFKLYDLKTRLKRIKRNFIRRFR
jgi:hypothetical protein